MTDVTRLAEICQRLSGNEFKVAMVICTLCEGNVDPVEINYPKLAKFAGVSLPSARRAIGKMETLGMVTVRRTPFKLGGARIRPNAYGWTAHA